jgi:hypothetical protein
MASLLGAAIFFIGIHILLAGTEVRWWIAGRIGEEAFQSIFGVLSLVGIIWLCRAYGQAEYVELWGQVQSMRWFSLLLMLPAFFLVGLAFTSPNPTAVRGGAWLKESEPARHRAHHAPSVSLGWCAWSDSFDLQRRSRPDDFYNLLGAGAAGRFPPKESGGSIEAAAVTSNAVHGDCQGRTICCEIGWLPVGITACTRDFSILKLFSAFRHTMNRAQRCAAEMPRQRLLRRFPSQP